MTLRLRRMLSASIAWMLPTCQCELYCVVEVSSVLLCRQQWLRTAAAKQPECEVGAEAHGDEEELVRPDTICTVFAPSRCNACCVHLRPLPLLVSAEIFVASSAATRHGGSALSVL